METSIEKPSEDTLFIVQLLNKDSQKHSKYYVGTAISLNTYWVNARIKIMNTTKENHQVCFHTGGIIDPIAWEIIGMSVKESDNPIGQFGSGLKFAIAILLRTGHQVYIITDGKRYDFGTTTKQFRGENFQVVTANGKEIGITTAMGKKWELWMAYRELVSNTLDEGGIHYAGEPMDHGSSIVVIGEDFHALLKVHEKYFVADREPLAETKIANVFRGDGTVYYRGVKVGELINAAYSYEVKEDLDLTEDRTIKYQWCLRGIVSRAICKYITDEGLLRTILTLSRDRWEYSLDYDYEWSPAMEKVVGDLWQNSPTTLNENICKLMKKKMPEVGWEIHKFDEEQTAMLDKAKEFLALAGYPVTGEIVLVKNQDSCNIAYVYKNVIHLTSRAFDKGLFYLVRALFEEQMHVNGYLDESRQFENYLIEQIIMHAKKHLKIVL